MRFFAIIWTKKRQSISTCLRLEVMIMKTGSYLITITRGVKRLLPPGIPKEACWILPANSWILFNKTRSLFMIFLSNSQINWYLASGSWIVPFLPSTIHPNISLTKLHVPSPFSSLIPKLDHDRCVLWLMSVENSMYPVKYSMGELSTMWTSEIIGHANEIIHINFQ